jgi:hypothetical protein
MDTTRNQSTPRGGEDSHKEEEEVKVVNHQGGLLQNVSYVDI